MSQISRAELDAALDHVAAAPKDGAAVEQLCLRPARNQREFVESLSLSKAQGIAGDRWEAEPWLKTEQGAPHPDIQVCILQKRVLDLVWRDRETVPHPGDTFIVDMDLSAQNLPAGTLLQVGEVVLRVGETPNDACAKWKVRYGTAAYDWVRDHVAEGLRLRGILCSIERDGVIRNGDRVTKLA